MATVMVFSQIQLGFLTFKTVFSEQWTCSNAPMLEGNETRLRLSTTSTISMTLRHSTCKDMRSTGHKSQNAVMLQADATHQTKLCKLRAHSTFIPNTAPGAGTLELLCPAWGTLWPQGLCTAHRLLLGLCCSHYTAGKTSFALNLHKDSGHHRKWNC